MVGYTIMSAATVSLSNAIEQIRSTLNRQIFTNPFFFMVGAGVSRPVPKADSARFLR